MKKAKRNGLVLKTETVQLMTTELRRVGGGWDPTALLASLLCGNERGANQSGKPNCQ